MIKVAAFTGGKTVPSARFRVRQYIAPLANLGIEINELPCRFQKYPPEHILARPVWLGALLAEQAVNLMKTRSYDVVLLQREIVSKLITYERWLGENVLLDVDDAFFLFRGGHIGEYIAKRASVVVCGNGYLADNFSKWNPRVHVIPTAVDTEAYRPRDQSRDDHKPTIGWIGTSSNLHELMAVEGALGKALEAFPKAKLRVVCDVFPKFTYLKSRQLEYIEWSEAKEICAIQGMDIGIMPLQDSAWARGKCAFKMLQYMACGLPSVVSPVGMNQEVLGAGKFSLAARTENEWADALVWLLGDRDARHSMGVQAREVAESKFSLRVLAPHVAAAIREVSCA